MQQNLHQKRRLTAYLATVLSGAALAMAVGGAPSSAWASSNSMTGMQTIHAATHNSKTVVLKHRRTVRVDIHDLAFGPTRLVVSPGTTIIWTNQDGFQHTTTSDQGIWDSGPINPDSTFKRAFKKVGVFAYHCTIHPFMHGTITVTK
jgi:plastocyanin